MYNVRSEMGRVTAHRLLDHTEPEEFKAGWRSGKGIETACVPASSRPGWSVMSTRILTENDFLQVEAVLQTTPAAPTI